MSVCPVCGKAFTPSRSFGFCSVKCYKKHWHLEKTKNVRKVCPICGKEFHPDVDHLTYCSPECKKEGNRRNRLEYKKREYNRPGHQTVVYERVCAFCGKPFTTIRKFQKYCCRVCNKTADNRMRNEERKAKIVVLTKTCAWCGEEFETTRHDKITCSYKCSYTYNKHRCSKSELESRRQAKREETVRRAAERYLKARVNGLTEKQMQDVIDAQDGDPSQLYRLSQSWTPAQHKYAKARYEEKHGIWSQTFRG